MKEGISEKKNQPEMIMLATSIILLLFVFSFMVITYLQSKVTFENNNSKISYAIHAFEPAEYSDNKVSVRFPGVKLSILWEILYDLNLTPQEVEQRIKVLEVQFSQPISEKKFHDEVVDNEDDQIIIENPLSPHINTPAPLSETPQPIGTSVSLFGPNPIVTNTETSIIGITPTPTQKITSSLPITGTTSPNTPSVTMTTTVFVSFTPTPKITNTASPTSTNPVIWSPTFTYTLIPSNTPLPPTFTPSNTPIPPTLTPSNTPVPPTLTPSNTPIPPTLTPTYTPIPSTFTPTIGLCNVTNANPITAVFVPPNNSENVSIEIQPIIQFNQSMNLSSFVYGGNNFTIAICEFENPNTCPKPKIIDVTIEFSGKVYQNDTVIIKPQSILKGGQSYLIFIGDGISPHPDCSSYSDPISTKIISKFITQP